MKSVQRTHLSNRRTRVVMWQKFKSAFGVSLVETLTGLLEFEQFVKTAELLATVEMVSPLTVFIKTYIKNVSISIRN